MDYGFLVPKTSTEFQRCQNQWGRHPPPARPVAGHTQKPWCWHPKLGTPQLFSRGCTPAFYSTFRKIISLTRLGCKQICSPGDCGLGLETARDRNSAVLVLALVVLVSKDRSGLFSRPISNSLACMRRKIIILFCTSK